MRGYTRKAGFVQQHTINDVKIRTRSVTGHCACVQMRAPVDVMEAYEAVMFVTCQNGGQVTWSDE